MHASRWLVKALVLILLAYAFRIDMFIAVLLFLFIKIFHFILCQ
jgi:hypothetical protein